jgi:hypothetical protein
LSLGLYRDVLDEEASYLLNYGEAQVVFAEDEEQVDKLLALAERVPRLKHIIYSDPRGMRKYDDPRLMSAEAFAELGRGRATREPELYDRLVDATKGEDVAILCTTSRNSPCSPPAACSAIARPISPSIRKGRTTNTSPCCRYRGSWSRSMCSAKASCAG